MSKSKKVKKDKGGNNSDVSQNKVKVKVYLRFGTDTRQLRATYIAEETRDSYNNLIVKNESFQHDEDVEFTQDEVYSSMRIALGIEGSSKDKATAVIEKRIERYNKRIKAIEKHPELNVLANIWDEKRKLQELKIYKNFVQFRSPKGSYYKIEEGIRVYEFESTCGFLIPIWHGSDNLVDYTDYPVQKKITMQETSEFKTYLDSKKKEKLKYASLFMVMLITAVLCGVFVFAILKTLGYHNESVAEWEKPANYCADQTASIVGSVSELFRNDVVKACLLSNNKTVNLDAVNNKIKDLQTNK